MDADSWYHAIISARKAVNAIFSLARILSRPKTLANKADLKKVCLGYGQDPTKLTENPHLPSYMQA